MTPGDRRLTLRRAVFAAYVGAMFLVIAGLLSVTTASNTVPTSRLGSRTTSTGISELRPPACSGMTLTNLVTGTGNVNGTNGNDLVLGGRGTKAVNGKAGDDCLLGGVDATSVDGGAGSDVCIRHATTKASNCEAIITQ